MNDMDLRKMPDFREELPAHDARPIGRVFASTICEILEANNINTSSALGVDLGAGTGLNLDACKSKGLHMLGIDARPRRSDIVSSRVEDMPFLKNNSVGFATSCLLFDGAEYDQDREKMKAEIARILSPNGMYIAFEFNEDLGGIVGCLKRNIPRATLLEYPQIIRPQVFKKSEDGEIFVPNSFVYDKRHMIGNRFLG